MAVKRKEIKVTTTGSDGSATGRSTTEGAINGKILDIHIDYHASAPATTDVTITERKGTTDIETIHTETDSKTDITRKPRASMEDNAESGVTYDGTRPIYENYVVSNPISVAVAGCNALTDAVVVNITYEE